MSHAVATEEVSQTSKSATWPQARPAGTHTYVLAISRSRCQCLDRQRPECRCEARWTSGTTKGCVVADDRRVNLCALANLNKADGYILALRIHVSDGCVGGGAKAIAISYATTERRLLTGQGGIRVVLGQTHPARRAALEVSVSNDRLPPCLVGQTLAVARIV